MEGNVWECSSNEDSDGEVYLQNASDEEELHFTSDSLPKLQFRNLKSKGRWNAEMGMAEIIEKNGKMWVTTGIVRCGKIFTSIEETLYLMEIEALHLVDNGDRSISLIEIYEKIAGGKFGCCWELFEAYRHLKSLGYIIKRHDVAWSLKSIRSSQKDVSLEGMEESKHRVDIGSKVDISINKLFGELKINDLKPDFDVYLPNSRFRKSSPGDSNFLLYLSSLSSINQCSLLARMKVITVHEERSSKFEVEKMKQQALPEDQPHNYLRDESTRNPLRFQHDGGEI